MVVMGGERGEGRGYIYISEGGKEEDCCKEIMKTGTNLKTRAR